MAYFWVQQWVALPVIVEEYMGDTTQDGGHAAPISYHQQFAYDESSYHSHGKPDGSFQPSPGISRPSSGQPPFFAQYNTIPSQQQRSDSSRYQQQQGYAAGGNHNQQGISFNMGGMAGALPDYTAQTIPNSGPQHPSQRQPGASTPAVVYQMQQNLQYPHQAAANYGGHANYGAYCQAQYAGYGQAPSPQSAGYPQFHGQQRSTPGPQQYGQYPPVSPQYYYFPGSTAGYSTGGFIPQAPMQIPMSGRGGPTSDVGSGEGFMGIEDYHGLRHQTSNSSLSPVPRGPPRKPKQSGHALWVGNLPPGATVMDLKDHFSRDATKDIESLFLISKSNCAFVNYRTEAACQSAMQRFHDSRFSGVRLVCRLRRSSTAASGIPTGPSAMAGRRPSEIPVKLPVIDGEDTGTEDAEQGEDTRTEEQANPTMKVAEKFFVVKSLTLQDLEQSVRNGIWATQSHNEHILNKAFESADNVYLVFSANKSGEYFGYARMSSPISEDATEIMRALPQVAEPVESSDAPKTIPTPSTEWAPKGRIIDDSARGTIFWEAEMPEEEEEESSSKAVGSSSESGDADGSPQVWGKPFKIEWLSTNRLPFYRTRGLRNPWNANREIKIARDGTELETNVGKRLVQMFHRPGPAPPINQMPMMGHGY